MGTGASKDEDIVHENGGSHSSDTRRRYPMSPAVPSGSQSSPRQDSNRRPSSRIIRQLSKTSFPQTQNQSSKPPLRRKNTVSKFIEGYEQAEVVISKSGFSMQNVQIMEGQSIHFSWESEDSINLNLLQVVHDGDKLRPVIGGYSCNQQQVDGKNVYEQKFNLEGDYKFAISGIRSTPLTVLVRPRVDLQAEVTEDGFVPQMINIDQGHTIKWSWVQCAVPHTVQEVTYNVKRGGFTNEQNNSASSTFTGTVSGSYRHVFKRPGLYYFQTESVDLGRTHLCVVHVRDTEREAKVEVLDRSFQPMIVLIEEGDRVWWHWDRFKCKKLHSVYQIEAPKVGHSHNDPYEPIKDGFRWTAPSKQGLLSYQFHIPGVYYFSDQNFDEAAEYIGTVIVKPKQKDHYIELTENGFSPDLWYAQTGDRIWWTWHGEQMEKLNQTFTICEIEKTLNPVTRSMSSDIDDNWQFMDKESARLCTRLGMATVQYTTVGVYHYRISDTPTSFSTSSIIVNPGPKNYTIHLTDHGFEPKVMTVRPNDRVWWVWQTGQKQHNVIQVSHQGAPIGDGFSSGAPRDCPSAFVHQFHSPGVYYFRSLSLPKLFGAVVVSTQPQVHQVQVSKSKLLPDPVVINVNDIICWVYPGIRHHDIQEVETVDQILDIEMSSKSIAPRRCMARAITKTGTIHFCSRSFQKKDKKDKSSEDIRLSTVISDDRFDNAVIRVTKQGFHPAELYMQKGESVLWSWKGGDEPHNIIHVTPVESQTPLNVVQGPKSFNSGKPVPSHSFLYTFDETGHFTVASQGAPGYSCTVYVLDNAERCREPYIVSDLNGGTVDRYAKVLLSCDTPGAQIYYTTDGSRPELNSDSAKLYEDEVILHESGLGFVRAMAVSAQKLNSHVFTSRRYWVLSQDVDEDKEAMLSARSSPAKEGRQTPVLDTTLAWKWLACMPTIKGCVTQPGEMEVFWEPPTSEGRELILGYQIFLNGISYCEMFPPSQNSINVAGLAGGRMYEIFVEVYPKSDQYAVQQSNKLGLTCPLATHDYGPVISLETTNRPDSLAVVWMSIDTEREPITGYLLFLNDQQVGQTLVPDVDSNRCKVVVEGCDLSVLYKMVVFALPKVGGKPKTSNILEILLPLKTAPIVLPPAHLRLDDEDLYKEFLEIREGSGYLTSMDEVDGDRGKSEFTQTPPKEESKAYYLINWDGPEVTSEDKSKSTQTPWREKEAISSQHPRSSGERLRGGTGKADDSESSDWENASDEDASAGDDVYMIDIAKPAKQTKTEAPSGRQKTRVSHTGRGVEIDMDTVDHSLGGEYTQAVVHSGGQGEVIQRGSQAYVLTAAQGETSAARKSRKPGERKRKRPKSAIIDVHDAVEFDVEKENYDDGRKRVHVIKTPALRSAPPGEKLPRPDLEGQFIVCDGDGILPAPSVLVENRGRNSVKVEWELPRQPDPQYRLLIYVVNVIGERFDANINSDISFDCNIEDRGKNIQAVQHCWNISGKHKCVVKGLIPSMLYRIYVVANYALIHGQKPCEIQTTSSVLYYTTLGPPKPPSIKIISVDLCQACLEWELSEIHEDYRIKGFQIFIDGKPLPDIQPRRVRQLIINHMIPGKTLSVAVKALSKHSGYDSDLSKTIHITCPKCPPAPVISQQPSYKKGCVLVAWNKPKGYQCTAGEEDISLYCIYTDDKWYGEIRANSASDKQGYQFFLTDLIPANNYDVSVKTVSGPRRVDAKSQHAYCLCDSDSSNIVPVMAPAAPHSPKIRIEGLHPDGIDVTWQVPQQFGDASISGYQMLKNGKLYGSVIPADVNSLRIKDVTLGERVDLQLIALTDHPVGKSELASTDKDSGIEGSSHPDDRAMKLLKAGTNQKLVVYHEDTPTRGWPRIRDIKQEIPFGERYAGCKPGLKLVVHYTGLVQPPSRIWCEQVTGHSALVVWKKDDHPKSHFVKAESYQVTWWPGNKPEEDINSDSTTGDHMLITNLKPSTTYTVVVEARKMQKYSDVDEDGHAVQDDDGLSAFILTSKSEQLRLKTASPPDAPTHLGVIATTCNSLKLAWNPPKEHGVEVIAIRIDCTPVKNHDPDEHTCMDLMPDTTLTVIENLRQHTDYLINVTAVTNEFFETLPDNHKLKKLHALPKDARVGPEDSPWLSCANILATTSGTDPPSNLRIVRASTSSLTLTWTPAVAYGTNKLQGTIVRWIDRRLAKSKDDDLVVASHVTLLPNENTLTIEDLTPGAQYRIVVEAVVSLKTSLEPDKTDKSTEQNRRTAHVMSEPLFSRTRAPTEPPRPLLVSHTRDSTRLYWEKPLLVTVVGKDEDDQPKYVRRYLEGYKIEINGKVHMSLGPSAQTCTLTKCKPGRTYSVVLVALSCTEDVKRERKKRQRSVFKPNSGDSKDYSVLLEDEEELDASPSEPLEITLPKSQEGFLSTLEGEFRHNEEVDKNLLGEIMVKWSTQGETINLLRQFNVLWYSEDDRVIQTKYVGPDQRQCTVPVIRNKVVYHVSVEPMFYTEISAPPPQGIQVIVPGPPDAPEIFLKSVEAEEFVVEWGEPRLYGGVKVRGYQVYLNDRKAGNELSSSHRKAIIPCRINRHYRLNLVALSAHPSYPDSGKSNSLLISTGPRTPRHGEGSSTLTLEDWSSMADDHEIVLKVTKVTDNSIHLDWSTHLETDGVSCYKVQWSSVAQPQQREVKLDAKESNCVINKCLPGTTHFVRLVSVSSENNVLDKSRQLTIQTSAPPEAPKLVVRACNFRYIAIQWEKPITYGDAEITGYKVYVNGIVETTLSPQQLSFTLTHGKWCQEYAFQVQAMTAYDRLNSKTSEPLILAWPGVKPPSLDRVPTASSRAVRVRWDAPYCTEGVKVKHYRLVCIDEDTGKTIQSLGPIHPDTKEAEVKGLRRGNCSVYLETHVYGTSEAVVSPLLRSKPAIHPDAPHVTVSVIGQEERRQLERITCELVNKRDRLIRKVSHQIKKMGPVNVSKVKEKNQEMLEAAQMLSTIEDLLESSFHGLAQYTGYLLAQVSWSCVQSRRDVEVSGYQVMVDGKQYGANILSHGVKGVRVKLSLDEPSHKISVVALTEQPQVASEESNTVEVLTETFQPFSFYCYHNVHSKYSRWPSSGCCRFDDSIKYERQLAKKLANQGLLNRQVPPPACSLLDVFDGEFKPLLTHNKLTHPTAMLFWTPWCLASRHVMDHYVKFASEASRHFNFIAITCNYAASKPQDRQQLIHTITENGWRDDVSLWHCTSQCASSVTNVTSNLRRSALVKPGQAEDADSETFVDLTELLGIAGVPTFLFIHQDGYISWHGRYCAYDYAEFARFMKRTFDEVLGVIPQDFSHEDTDTTIDPYIMDTLLKYETSNQSLSSMTYGITEDNTVAPMIPASHYPRISLSSGNLGPRESPRGKGKVFVQRKKSARSKAKKGSRLSVNTRPFSANGDLRVTESPYNEHLVENARKQRPASAKKRVTYTF